MRKKDDEKQKNIKEAVIKLILEEGFHGTSISKIAKKAGVSPATVYVYYENKEIMLHKIYQEYSEEIYSHLLSKIYEGISGRELIEVFIRSYYNYIEEHEEIFRFVDQFSSCPALANRCKKEKGSEALKQSLEQMKEKKIIKNFHSDNLTAIIFSPIKSIAINPCLEEEEKIKMLEEMISIIQYTLLL
ncbi:TetR/AcrR family transcriptional regulator [Clostridium sp. CX1]|uniref:TetR/AcrR family transcriptional regulator n=1 Tax=Clostridium sp. CX1 TaxID=2978346 RepID=UPI0021C19DB7|nr:TetR/AcrR family transcriptional regulator [Clostridium sp. CX1]MCT8977144.1 TetR/AcrR family transcriptional regulator [Clostridium sp. CX1]